MGEKNIHKNKDENRKKGMIITCDPRNNVENCPGKGRESKDDNNT